MTEHDPIVPTTAGPIRFAIFVAVAVAVLLTIGGWIAIRHEMEHRSVTKEEVRSAEARAAYMLFAGVVDRILADGALGRLGDRETRRTLDEAVSRLAADTQIRKVKLFDAQGRLVYANPGLVDDPGHDDQALRAALDGAFAKQSRAVSDWPAIGRPSFSGHIFGAYFPHRLDGARPLAGAVDLVVEVYIDITDLVARVEHEFEHNVVAIVSGLSTLYLFFIAVIVWGTRMALRMQRVEREGAVTAKRSEVQLREAKRRAEENEFFLREAIGSMEHGFLLLDRDKRCVFWNDRYVELLPPVAPVLRRGAPLRELIAALAHSPLYAITESERSRWTEAAVPRLWNGRPFRRRLSDGRTLRIGLVPTQDGGRVLSLQDVTADLLAEDRMARLGLVAEHTDNAVLIVSAAGTIEWANAGFTRISGLDASGIEGRSLVDVLAASEAGTVEHRRIAEAVAAGEGFEAEIHSQGKAGEQFWLQLASTPVRDDLGHVTRHVVIASDVTSRKLEERRLADTLARERQMAAQQKRFVAVAAHELRTPLTIIDGAAQRLVRDADRVMPEELRERARRIRTGVARLSELVNSTLDVARLDEGRLELDIGSVDLGSLISDVARRLTGITGAMKVAISGASDPVVIEGDARLLDRVFVNLLSNAIKYSGDSRSIEIVFSDVPEAGSVSVSIRDHGIGIPEAEMPKLFQRFYRASTAKNLPGTGIGLHLVRELVELHGGGIEVRSKVGEGSEFLVRLPRRQDRGTRTAEGSEAAA